MTTTSNFGLPIYGNNDIPKWTDTNEAFQDLDSKAADKTGDNSFSGTNTFGGQVTHNADLLMKGGSTVESDDGVITPTAPSSDKTGTDVIQINDSAGNPLYKVRPIQHSNGKVDLDIAGQPAANGGTLTFNGDDVMNQGGMHTYSTTEERVGTWIDDKPVYERTLVVDNCTTYEDGAVRRIFVVSNALSGIDTLVDVSGNIYVNSGTYYQGNKYGLPQANMAANGGCVWSSSGNLNGGGLELVFAFDKVWGITNVKFTVTVRYTKQ